MSHEMTINWTIFILALGLAHALAWLFNLAIGIIENDQDGYTWLLVATGVGGTLALSLVIVPWVYVVILLAFFAASGLPMALGDIYRTKRRSRAARNAEQERARAAAEEVLNGKAG